jgi:putative restriction endonuclease
MKDKHNKPEKNSGRRWTREELLVAFNIYCRTPFGRLHKSNPEIIRIAKLLKRTPDALAMKLVNFASLDPYHKSRNIKGLANVSKADRNTWEEFNSNWVSLSYESQEALNRLLHQSEYDTDNDQATSPLYRETEKETLKRTRLVQSFFRETILAIYNSKCAICAISLPELLNASHIIPWNVDDTRRADPTNGLALCTLHDRAFDRGLISINNSYNVILSVRAKQEIGSRFQQIALIEFEGHKISLPDRFWPDMKAIEYHRKSIFVNE